MMILMVIGGSPSSTAGGIKTTTLAVLALTAVNRLRGAGSLDYIPLGERYTIREVMPPKEFFGKTLAELKVRNRFGVQVLAVREARTGDVTVSPPADFIVRDSHILVVLGANPDLDRLVELGSR